MLIGYASVSTNQQDTVALVNLGVREAEAKVLGHATSVAVTNILALRTGNWVVLPHFRCNYKHIFAVRQRRLLLPSRLSNAMETSLFKIGT